MLTKKYSLKKIYWTGFKFGVVAGTIGAAAALGAKPIIILIAAVLAGPIVIFASR